MNWRKAIAPGMLLAALLLAFALRYETEASRTTERTQIKYVRDRWTGRLWERRYGQTSSTSPVFQEKTVESGYPFLPTLAAPESERLGFTAGWAALALMGSGILVWAVRPSFGRGVIAVRWPQVKLPRSLRTVLVWVAFGAAVFGGAALIAFRTYQTGAVVGYDSGYADGHKAGDVEGYERGVAAGIAQEKVQEAERTKAAEGYETLKAKYDACVKEFGGQGYAPTSLRVALRCPEKPKPPK